MDAIFSGKKQQFQIYNCNKFIQQKLLSHLCVL